MRVCVYISAGAGADRSGEGGGKKKNNGLQKKAVSERRRGRIGVEKAEAENRRFTTDTVPNLLLLCVYISRSGGG